ncbi:MAG: hypothetical protein KUA35_07275 [Pseudodesulfovibrio sp.]|nr:hypothetical protein [Pseudomonadota bacterium]MBV1764013.1 hypothetical protein [Pseudodesulfovibrio sp.]MCG2732401.1 hypothetical protein [Pseudodesulfovibrio aespoeensis]MBU4522072.1 hypothetical protein [Pseudomonadota bacterium]MBU4557771.1 hypothetical protein [Pseudomonadota bacterium]
MMQKTSNIILSDGATIGLLVAVTCIIIALSAGFALDAPFDFSDSVELDGRFIIMPRNCYLIKP